MSKPGFYWVLYRHDEELMIARLIETDVGPLWLMLGCDDPIDPEFVSVHSGPIAHPYDGRWSMCVHPEEFRRDKRCVYCGTFDVTGSAAVKMRDDSTQKAYEAREHMESVISKPGRG